MTSYLLTDGSDRIVLDSGGALLTDPTEISADTAMPTALLTTIRYNSLVRNRPQMNIGIGAPVFEDALAPSEMLTGLVGQLRNANSETLAPVLAGSPTAVSTLGRVQRDATTVVETLLAMLRDMTAPSEMLGAVQGARYSMPVDVALTVLRDALGPIEQLGSIAVTPLLQADFIAPVSNGATFQIERLFVTFGIFASSAAEIFAGVAKQSPSPIEDLGGVGNTNASPIDLTGPVITGQIFQIEKLEGVVAAAPAPAEVLSAVDIRFAIALEELGSVAASPVMRVETLATIVRSMIAGVETTAPASGTTATMPIEVSASVDTRAIMPIERLVAALRDNQIRIELLAGIAGDADTGTSWTGQLVLDTPARTEFLGTVVAIAPDLPVEQLGDVVATTIVRLNFHGLALIAKARLCGSKVQIELMGEID